MKDQVMSPNEGVLVNLPIELAILSAVNEVLRNSASNHRRMQIAKRKINHLP